MPRVLPPNLRILTGPTSVNAYLYCRALSQNVQLRKVWLELRGPPERTCVFTLFNSAVAA